MTRELRRQQQLRAADHAGFTFVEATIVVALLMAILSVVGTAMTAAQKSLHEDDKIALAMESLQRSAVRISQIMRPCSISTYRVPSTAADVPTYAAAAGEWMEPIEEWDASGQIPDPRPSVRFQAADGRLSLNAASLTPERVFRLELDPAESDNDVDDDGDGMVDEGRIMMDYDGVPVALATNVESISFTLIGRLVTIVLKSAATGNDGRVHRFSVEEVLYLRNN